jgi:ubiquinone biosynthesis protein
MRLRVLGRILEIQRALVRHGLDDFIQATHLYRPFRFLFYLSPWTWFQRSAGVTRGERLRLALEELGPIFIKFGQALSTRRDLIPLDIADELAKLQDRVPPFPSSVAVTTIESALGAPLAEVFSKFDDTPLAAASIAQVHAATLKSGEDVVVKILRPGMHQVIDRDIEVLQTLARLANEYWTDARRLRPIEIVDEYRKTILDELDLMREAANAAQLKRNFAGSTLLHVPQVYWDYCRTNVMVMERIHGIIISRMDELRARGTNFAKLAERGVEIFFRFFGTTFSMPICIPAISSYRSRIRKIHAMQPLTLESSVRCSHETNITSLKTSSRSSIAITREWRHCMWNPVGYPPALGSMNSNLRCERSASPYSTSR